MRKLVLAGAAAAAGYIAYQARSPQARSWGRGFHCGRRDRQQIALTFDDGPTDWTLPVLEVLERYDVPATFFFCGLNVERRPDLAAFVQNRGYEIGNHTYSHPLLLALPRERVRRELTRTQEAIHRVVGVQPALFRPPYGCRSPWLRSVEQELGLTEVLWTVIGNDWQAAASAITRRVLEGVEAGGIVCLHDGDSVRPEADRRQTVTALKQFLPVLLDEGYSFVTAGAMLRSLVAAGDPPGKIPATL